VSLTEKDLLLAVASLLFSARVCGKRERERENGVEKTTVKNKIERFKARESLGCVWIN